MNRLSALIALFPLLAAAQSADTDAIRLLEAKSILYRQIEEMRAEGKALTLSDEEIGLLRSFRRFKLRMRKDGEVFTWQTRRPDGVQVCEDTAEIVDPAEHPLVRA